MIKTVIVDDEPLVLAGLCEMINQYCPEVSVVGTARNGKDALSMIENTTPQLVFLDVELGGATGMDILQKLHHRSFQLIFITAYQKYAIDAFRFSAIEFLLKPIDPEDLTIAVNKVRQQLEADTTKLQLDTLMENLERLSNQERQLIVQNQDSIFVLKVKDIAYCEASGGYTFFKMTDQRKILASKNLKTFEGLLSGCGFYRIHHSYIVNLRHVARYDRADSQIELHHGDTIPVSNRKKEVLITALKNQIF